MHDGQAAAVEIIENTWIPMPDGCRLSANEVSLKVIDNDGAWRLDDLELTLGYDVSECYRYCNDDYATLSGEVVNHRSFERGDWSVVVTTRTELTATPTHFCINAAVDTYEGGDRVFASTWNGCHDAPALGGCDATERARALVIASCRGNG